MYGVDYFKQINHEESEQAIRLAKLLNWKYSPNSVADIGSATGLYLKPFYEMGIKVTGIDSAISVIDPSVVQIPKNMIKNLDITKDPIKIKADLSLCIEVFEHINEKYAEKAVENLISISNTIIFSAAQPGQGGLGHINCQPKEYWQKLFNSNGYVRDLEDEEYFKIIMASGYHMGWLINNLMVFKKNLDLK